MKILSCGAGMQSTALALMACENVLKGIIHPNVPIYDAIIFCDLGEEPLWVYKQVDFIKSACEKAGIPFYVLHTHLYDDYINNFGKSRVVSVPFWSIDENGKKAKMRRHCTIDYKIEVINKFVKWTLLGYKKGQRIKPDDIKAHEMHIGFSSEEKHRARNEGKSVLFTYKYPLVEIGLERKDNYKYCLEVWGLDTKASACCICPFHRNFFFKYLKENYPDNYQAVLKLDSILEEKQSQTMIKSKVYISRSRKRIADLTDEDCSDAEMFLYGDKLIWNGF